MCISRHYRPRVTAVPTLDDDEEDDDDDDDDDVFFLLQRSETAAPEAAARMARLQAFDAEAASVLRRAEPLGEDRHGRLYWNWQGALCVAVTRRC